MIEPGGEGMLIRGGGVGDLDGSEVADIVDTTLESENVGSVVVECT